MTKTQLITIATRGLFLSILLGCCEISLSATVFGHIDFVEGTVSIVNPKGESRIAHHDDAINEGDTIVTGRDGELHALTDDHGMVAIRSNTKMKVDGYSAKAEDTDKTELSLLVGACRIISGWIGKYHSHNYAVRTPTATIGIRGTDHEIFVIAEPAVGERPIGLPGTYEKVSAGVTVLQNASGQVVVNANQTAYSSLDGKSMPQLLDRIPEFYHTPRNESRFERRKIEIERELEVRHEERLKRHARHELRENIQRRAQP